MELVCEVNYSVGAFTRVQVQPICYLVCNRLPLRKHKGALVLREYVDKRQTYRSFCPTGYAIVTCGRRGFYCFVFYRDSYEGNFNNGRMHGVGVYRWPHGDVYRGSWQNDRRSGRGRYEWTELGLTFEGMFHDDRRTGRGSIIFPDQSR